MKLLGLIITAVFWIFILVVAIKYIFKINIFKLLKTEKDKQDNDYRDKIIEDYKKTQSKTDSVESSKVTASAQDEKYERLKKIKELRDSEILTAEEYEAEKKEILKK